MNKYNNYISAEITLFWTARPENYSGHLVFAVTELIPKNQMASAPLGGGNSKYLYCNIAKNDNMIKGATRLVVFSFDIETKESNVK